VKFAPWFEAALLDALTNDGDEQMLVTGPTGSNPNGR